MKQSRRRSSQLNLQNMTAGKPRFMSRLKFRDALALVAIVVGLAVTTLLTMVTSASRTANGTNVSAVSHAPDGRAFKTLTRLARRNAMTPLPSITATLADDIGLGSKKNPGDTITYTAIITNGGTDASNVIYT